MSKLAMSRMLSSGETTHRPSIPMSTMQLLGTSLFVSLSAMMNGMAMDEVNKTMLDLCTHYFIQADIN